MLKFKNYTRSGELAKRKRLTFEEIHNGEMQFLKVLQNKMCFHENREKLTTLSTFVHSDGLIRLKTKILERDYSFSFLI